jgi:ATP-dependent helicase STH1/SNF2
MTLTSPIDPIPFGTTQPALNGHVNGDASSSSLSSGLVSGSAAPPPSQSPVSFTAEQTNALRAQIHAFKLLQRGLPVPENVQQALHVPNSAVPDLDKLLHQQPADVSARIVDNLVKSQRGESVPIDLSKTQQQQQPSTDGSSSTNGVAEDATTAAGEGGGSGDANSTVYPYNAFRHPFTHLRRPQGMNDVEYATRLQRLLVPALMPAGLDPHQIMAERDRFIEARIQQRIRELEEIPSTLGDGGFVGIGDEAAAAATNGTVHGKLKAILELKGLRVLDKQRALRAMIAERLGHGAMIPLNRSDFRRVRKPMLRDARATEVAERRQRVDRERRAKHKHVEQLVVICDHGREVLSANRAAQDRALKLGRAVLAYHQQTEKEEQKRIERISKERLKALKADDEEAYMKLIDTAKDTRITHLLKQTDAYLESLAQAVVAQQNEGGPMMTPVFATDDGPTNEATFGAQVASDDIMDDKSKIDYYSVAHKIKEKVSRQPSILVGGTLKEYQLKGLQWMVSLYNNRLNGILADEMVKSPWHSSYYIHHSFSRHPLGSRQDDPNDLAHHLPDRVQKGTRTVPRYRAALDDDELDGRVCQVGPERTHDLLQG